MSRPSILAVILAAGTQAACLVQITRVSDPGPVFAQARRDAARHQGRPGPARELNVLVFEKSERKLVRVSVPMWIVRAAERRVDWEKEIGGEGGDEVAWRVRRHVRLEDIEKAGLGILAEVEEEDGEQVLVWLR
ncbi:MAG TPA: hypothetical protein VMT87_10345 [Vicinamibacteria bacterium]|nr:hypothetical protein [Vicinamibacteria bacterium]